MNEKNIEKIKDYLINSKISGASDEVLQENLDYVNQALNRFLITMKLIPNASKGKRLLELGAAPFFLTLLIKKFRNYDIKLANYFKINNIQKSVTILNEKYNEKYTFDFDQFNSERDRFPYPDATFDLVLVCELIEHLCVNPVHMLSEIHRVLKKKGILILTTPNALSNNNIISLLREQNIYFRYSGYGPYGRHNREYTPAELSYLLDETGFLVEKLEIHNIHRTKNKIKTFLKYKIIFLAKVLWWCCSKNKSSFPTTQGEHIFIVSRRKNHFNYFFPNILFQNMNSFDDYSLYL